MPNKTRAAREAIEKKKAAASSKPVKSTIPGKIARRAENNRLNRGGPEKPLTAWRETSKNAVKTTKGGVSKVRGRKQTAANRNKALTGRVNTSNKAQKAKIAADKKGNSTTRMTSRGAGGGNAAITPRMHPMKSWQDI